MNCFLKNIYWIAAFLISFGHIVEAQIYNPATGEYRQVFVDQDAFDATYLDTLDAYWNMSRDDSTKYSMLNDLAYYWHTRNLNTALQYTLQGLNLSERDSEWQGRFQITLGAILLRMEKLDSAFYVLQAATKTVPEEDMAFLNTQLGYVFERRGELDKAADYALESLRLGEELNDVKAIAVAYSDLSNIFWKQSKFEQGIEYGLRSIRLFEERGIKDMDYDFTLYVVGNNYLALNNHSKALEYFNRSMEMGEQYGFYNNLSDVYISLTDLYTILEEFEKAEESGANAVKYAELLENNFMIMRSWLSIGKLQVIEGKYNEAITSLSTCIETATETFGDEYFLHQAYQTQGQAYAKLGQYQNAYEAFLKYDILKDQIFTSEADQRISLLQTEFDVKLKESTIELQETQLAQQNTRIVIILIVAAFLLLLTILLYFTYQSNKKKSILLEKQNVEKEFLLKEIHHRVKNNLETVSSLLALQSEKLTDVHAVDAMQESQNRVQSMSIIHQKLYQGTNLSTIEMKDYFSHLSGHVLDSFAMEDRVQIECEMEKLELDVDTAIPLGLIVNELLTNALKYAFPKNRNGKVHISLNPTSINKLKLLITDDGIGQKVNGTVQGTGFGTQLIQLLCQQIRGTLTVTSDEGTRTQLDFHTS